MTERILVQAAQSGRSEATDELVERYYPRVYSFVATLQSGDAEDLTQEVFARALGALPRFNGEYQFGAWLLQIARNVCIDEARRQVRRPRRWYRWLSGSAHAPSRSRCPGRASGCGWS